MFKPLAFDNRSVVKIATEPLNPSDLPKMVEGLRKINKSYPLAVTKVEESGEHTIMGTGEMFLDSVMKDLRELYSEVEVKVADPGGDLLRDGGRDVQPEVLRETPNKKNKLTMIASPWTRAGEGHRGGAVFASVAEKKKQISSRNYDTGHPGGALRVGVRSGRGGSQCATHDTLPGEVDKSLLAAVRESVVQGFQWGTRGLPCDEPIRDAKFKILDAVVADQPLHRGGGQMIPTARRVAYSAFPFWPPPG